MANFPEHTASSSGKSTAAIRIRILQVVAVALVVAAIVLLLRGLLTPASPTNDKPGHATSDGVVTATAAPADPLVGHLAPNATIYDMRGKLTPLASLRGSVVLLNFWYVACSPCQIEMPALERAYRAHKAAGFQVVGVDVVDDAQTISIFTSRLGITYPILRDLGQRAVIAYQVRATPSSFLMDRTGVIRAVYAGPITSSTFDQQVTALLAGG